MGGFGTLGALGGIANQVEDARELQRKRATEALYNMIAQSQLGLAKTREQREAAEFKSRQSQSEFERKLKSQKMVVRSFRGVDGKTHNIVQDPLTGTLSEEIVGGQEASPIDEKVAAFKQLFGREPNDQEKEKLLGVTPSETSLAQKWQEAMGIAKQMGLSGVKAEEFAKSLMPGGAGINKIIFPGMGPSKSGASEKVIKALADKWNKEGVKPPAKFQADVEEYMEDRGMKSTQLPTPVERKLSDDIKKVAPKVDEMVNFLEDNGMTQQGQGGMFSTSAWYERAKVQKAWQEYSHGLAPSDKKLGQLIKYAASIKIMGAAPWMSIGRGKYLYSEIVQHLPETTDTPAQLYEKVQFYKGILDDARGSLPESLQSGAPSQDQQVIKWTRDAQGNPTPAQ